MQQDKNPEHTANTTKDFIREVKVEGSKMAKTIARPWPNWACISPPEEEIEGKNPPKQTTSERSCSKSLEKHLKIRTQQFGDVNGLQAWCT